MQIRHWFARALWITGLLLSLTSAALLLFLVINVVKFPLELEVRESPVWLHVLALRAGINVFIDETHIFINMSHGPMDTLLKAGLASSCRSSARTLSRGYSFWGFRWHCGRRSGSCSGRESIIR